jgi:hypothetical protein
MLKKVSLVLSVIAALGFAVATSAPADAAQEKNKTVRSTTVRSTTVRTNRVGNVRSNVRTNRNVGVNRSAGVNRVGRASFVVGRRYGGNVYYGHNRHRWHNTWYGYGEGPCWINVDGEWFWNVIACP